MGLRDIWKEFFSSLGGPAVSAVLVLLGAAISFARHDLWGFVPFGLAITACLVYSAIKVRRTEGQGQPVIYVPRRVAPPRDYFEISVYAAIFIVAFIFLAVIALPAVRLNRAAAPSIADKGPSTVPVSANPSPTIGDAPIMTKRPVFISRGSDRRIFARVGLFNTSGDFARFSVSSDSRLVPVPRDAQAQNVILKRLRDHVAAILTATYDPTEIAIPPEDSRFTPNTYVTILGKVVSDKDWGAILAGKDNAYIFALLSITLANGTRTTLPECDIARKGAITDGRVIVSTECEVL
jgi:hypothetical protein